MKPLQNSPEDDCSKAVQLRRVCFREFDEKQHRLHLKLCFAELRKANKVSQAWQQNKSFLTLKSRPPKILGPLDAIVIPGPSIFITLFDKLIPDTIISRQMSKFELFQMRRFNLISGSVSFKPLFSQHGINLPVSEYVCITLTTKVVLLLLEVAQLDFWAARFYEGLGYARIALEFSAALVNQFPSVSRYALLLHHAVTYVALTGICVIVSQEHQHCYCCMQFGEVARSCQNLFNTVKDVGLLLDEGCFEKMLSSQCWIGDLFVECLTLTNDHNMANVITRRRIIAFSVYLEITRNSVFMGANPESVFDMRQSLVEVFNATDRQYESDDDYFMQAIKCYVIGCNHSLFSSIKGNPHQNDSDEDAEAVFQNCMLHLKAIGRVEFYSQARYQTLYSRARTGATLAYLRCSLRQVHDKEPSLRLNVCNYLRELRKEHLAKDKLLDPSLRDACLASVSLVNLYLSDTVDKLMSYKKGKHIDKLRDSLEEAKKTLQFLLPVEENSSFCRILLSDLVKHWNWSQEYHSFSCFDLDPILILVKGMTIVARASKHRKQEAVVKHRKQEAVVKHRKQEAVLKHRKQEAVMEHRKRFNDENINRENRKRDGGEAIEGDGGEAIEGDGGEAIEGDGGEATEGDGGEATEGDGGEATEGDGGEAIEGDGGEATEGDGGEAIEGDGGGVKKCNVGENCLERAEGVNGLNVGEHGTGLEEDALDGLAVKKKGDGLKEGEKVDGLKEGEKVDGLQEAKKVVGLQEADKVVGLQEADKVVGLQEGDKVVGLQEADKVVGLQEGEKVVGLQEGEKVDGLRENGLIVEKTIVESTISDEIIVNRLLRDELNKLFVLHDGINFKECYEIFGTIETALEKALTRHVEPLPNEIDPLFPLRAPALTNAPVSTKAPAPQNVPAPPNVPSPPNAPAPSNAPVSPNAPASPNAPVPPNAPASPIAPAPPNVPSPPNAPAPPNAPVPPNVPSPPNAPAPPNAPVPPNAPAPPNAPVPPNAPAPPNAPDHSAKSTTKVKSIRHKQRVATNSPRSEGVSISHTDEHLPAQPNSQRLAMEYLFNMDYSPYVEDAIYNNVTFTRGSACWEELKKTACRLINKALMNEELLGSPPRHARSESSEDSTEESLRDRLEEALRILCVVPGNASKILEGFVEVADVLGIRTVFDNEEDESPTSGRML